MFCSLFFSFLNISKLKKRTLCLYCTCTEDWRTHRNTILFYLSEQRTCPYILLFFAFPSPPTLLTRASRPSRCKESLEMKKEIISEELLGVPIMAVTALPSLLIKYRSKGFTSFMAASQPLSRAHPSLCISILCFIMTFGAPVGNLDGVRESQGEREGWRERARREGRERERERVTFFKEFHWFSSPGSQIRPRISQSFSAPQVLFFTEFPCSQSYLREGVWLTSPGGVGDRAGGGGERAWSKEKRICNAADVILWGSDSYQSIMNSFAVGSVESQNKSQRLNIGKWNS